MLRRLAPFTVGLLALLLTAASPTLALGAVVGLAGTPHLWIADSAGVLHWGGDTRALSGKHVNWSDRRDVALTELQTFPIGDPWLSAGLLKDGDPIYQVKWETEWPQPKLLHVQSIKDVELFGINGGNYGNFVIDKAVWEQRYGLAAAGLQRGVLAAAVPATIPVPTPALTSKDGGYVAFPPLPHRDISFTIPTGWITYTGLGDFLLPGQTLVTSIIRRASGGPHYLGDGCSGGELSR